MSGSAGASQRFVVRPGGPLRGSLRVPGDKSIGHRALIFAALGEGTSTLRGLSGGLDNRATAEAFRAMGVPIAFSPGEIATIEGVGLFGLKMAKGALDCGNSGTTMRLLAGLLSAQEFGTRLVGDASLSRRPMRRILEPLRARGAHIGGVSGKKEGELYPPLSIAPQLPEEGLSPLEYRSPIASAQVKSCILLSGLYAKGLTAVSEPVLSRDHTERMLSALGVPLEALGPMIVLDPGGWSRRWDPFDWEIPGDLSSAAFVIAAAALIPGSEVRVEHLGVNPTRTGFLEVLRQMGADMEILPQGDTAGLEPVADLIVRGPRRGSPSAGAPLRAARVGGELLTRMIDEVPVLAALATGAGGRSEIRDARELRVKESDRLAASARVLGAFGADVVELDDGLLVHGGPPLRGAEVRSEGDHRVAMSAAVLGLLAEGQSVIEDVACVETSFPGFASTLASLGADIRLESS